MHLLQTGILTYLITVSLGILQLEKLVYQCNVKRLNMTITHFSNEEQEIVLNVTFDNKSVVRKLIGYLKINFAESPDDTVFKKEYLRMTIDHDKLFNGGIGGFVLRAFMENLKSSANFDLKFPLKKGVHKFSNFIISDRLVPFPLTARGSVECRYLAKVDEKKSFEHVFTWKAVGSITKGI